MLVAQVTVPLPLRRQFDYVLPENAAVPSFGTRVRVPFGKRDLVGIVVATSTESTFPVERLKSVKELLDEEPLFDDALWATLHWLSRYYLAPLGEVLDAALPTVLRKGSSARPSSITQWSLSEFGRGAALDDLQRAPLQLALIKRFVKSGTLGPADFVTDTTGWRTAIKSLIKKGWLDEHMSEPMLNTSPITAKAVSLNKQQLLATHELKKTIDEQRFSSTLLHGVTGSGKTEVYFDAMQRVLKQGKQILLLVPEIGLTPQLVDRIEASFESPVVALHSGLNDNERHQGWWHAKTGNAGIVIGTRSAVFTPLRNPGLIVVDEEHDSSFKQQEGVRYHARDVAIYRAKQMNIPIILGSATPALESYKNASDGKYRLLTLNARAQSTPLPKIELFDIRRLPVNDGMSPPMISAIEDTLAANKQVMLFLNRRGYAPVLYCVDCGHVNHCDRCDANLTFHQRSNRLRCHHCGYESSAISNCRSCASKNLAEVGEGTQRVEDALNKRFPDARIARIDRDSTRRKGELEEVLKKASEHHFDILLGTQLLTKGHDFPGVAMVGVLGADQGLFSTDFRARESLFQQLLQVAGRAGRREEVGKVYIQTAFIDDPFFEFVKKHDYTSFAEKLLIERSSAEYPPFGYFALVRAESTYQSKALQFLRQVRDELTQTLFESAKINDAIPAPMERRAGRYRAQLLIQSDSRAKLNQTLLSWLNNLETNKELKTLASSVRWSLDIDPVDLY